MFSGCLWIVKLYTKATPALDANAYGLFRKKVLSVDLKRCKVVTLLKSSGKEFQSCAPLMVLYVLDTLLYSKSILFKS